jgi:hypothetical protein
MMTNAFVTDNHGVYEALVKSLNYSKGHRAFLEGDGRMGYAFDRVVFLYPVDTDSEWYGHFMCCLKPDGVVTHSGLRYP